MLGGGVYSDNMDSGKRWLLKNAVGQPLRTWDERDHEFAYEYDALGRPTISRVAGGDGTTSLNNIYERIFYGEAESSPKAKNLRGQIVRYYDTGGRTEIPQYDFKG